MATTTPAEVFERYRAATPGSGEHFEHARTVYMPFDRICINAAHTKEDIEVFLAAFERALEAAGLVGN